MKIQLAALLFLAGFTVGVLYSSLVRAFLDRQLLALSKRAGQIEDAAKAEAEALRVRVVELESKVKRGLGV